MIRNSTWVVGAVALVCGALPVCAEEVGAALFANHCAVCHGPAAAGIPGAFPSLHEQIVAFARAPEGRDYLVMVVTTGLMGDLKVAGVSYRGVMPAQSGLSEAQVAAVLSSLAIERPVLPRALCVDDSRRTGRRLSHRDTDSCSA